MRHSRRPTSGDAEPHAHIRRLRREFPKDRRLASGTVYALPLALIASIRKHAPDVLSPADAKFERRLRELTATGLCKGRLIFSEILDGSRYGTGEFPYESIADRERIVDRRMRQKTTEVFATDDVRKGVVESREKLRSEIDRRVQLRLKGYTGWLATNLRFQAEMSGFRDRYGPSLEDSPYLVDGERLRTVRRTVDAEHPSQFVVDTSVILQRWALRSIATWDLPEPALAGLWSGDEIPQNGIAPSGVSLHLPWPLMADRDLKLREVMEVHRSAKNLDHLAPWIQGESKWGHERYAKLLEVFVYWRLAVAVRYPDRVARGAEALERAFSAFWTPEGKASDVEAGRDSVRRIRQRMERRLTDCRAAIDSGIGSGIPGLNSMKTDDHRSEDELLRDLEMEMARQRAELSSH